MAQWEYVFNNVHKASEPYIITLPTNKLTRPSEPHITPPTNKQAKLNLDGGIPVIPALRNLKLEDQLFKTSLAYTARLVRRGTI